MKTFLLLYLFLTATTIYASDQALLYQYTTPVINLLRQSQEMDFNLSDSNAALTLFKDLANSFKNIEALKVEEPWKVHLPELEELGEEFLILSRGIPQLEEERLEPFFEDLERASSSQASHYEWFITFIDALSIVNTNPSDWFNDKNNTTFFDTYHAEIIRQMVAQSPRISPEIYRQTIASVGNAFTKKFASTKAVARCFPSVVVLPYPYNLTDEDIVMTLPTPTNAFWPAGFNLSKQEAIGADGEVMPRRKFFAHDLLHFVVYRNNLSTITLLSDADEVIAFGGAKGDILRYRKLFFQCVTIAQNLIQNLREQEIKGLEENLPEKDALSLKRRLTVFFSFLIFHEFRMHVEERLRAFALKEYLTPLFLNETRMKIRKSMTNPLYYSPLLPAHWQNDDREVLKDKLLAFSSEFLELFAHQAKQSFPNDNIIENLKSLEKYMYYKQEIIKKYRFDPSAYRLFYTLEQATSINGLHDKIAAGYLRLITQAIGNDTFPEVFGKPKVLYHLTYFSFLGLETSFQTAPDLIEKFVFVEHSKAQIPFLFPDCIEHVNNPIDNHQNTSLIWAIALQD